MVMRARVVRWEVCMWEAVKRRWREDKLWITAVAVLLIGCATLSVYINAKATAMAEAALGAGLS